MEHIKDYVKPELLIVAIALYFLGTWLKQAAFIKDKYIPILLGAVGVFICGIWVMSTAPLNTGRDVAMAIFASLTQGILVAGLSTYANQIFKQLNKCN